MSDSPCPHPSKCKAWSCDKCNPKPPTPDWKSRAEIAEADRDRLAAENARLRAEVLEEQWRDMGSAPKDGTIVQCWHIIHEVPIAVRWLQHGILHQGRPLTWLEASCTTAWPDEAFSHWRATPLPPGAAHAARVLAEGQRDG